jgi:twitching motility protein PilT
MPPRPISPHSHPLPHVDEYLALGQEAGASDIHLGVNAPPIWRLHGTLQPIWPDAPRLTSDQTLALAKGFLSNEQETQLNARGDADFAYANLFGRYRTSVVRQRLGVDLVFRIINTKVRTMDELGLPEHLKLLTRYQNGLILVTGSVGSGKSTTLTALAEQVNRERREHIITLEDPIEYVFEPKGCHITQREVHMHTRSFAAALRGALREDPDVIVVGEMRDLETISLAITAAETGDLVLGTLHTGNASRTLDRLLDVELPLSVSFGRTNVPVHDILKLGSGSIIELNCPANDLVEIIVNNCMIARGEVVVIEGNYGVRVREIISRSERMALQNVKGGAAPMRLTA